MHIATDCRGWVYRGGCCHEYLVDEECEGLEVVVSLDGYIVLAAVAELGSSRRCAFSH